MKVTTAILSTALIACAIFSAGTVNAHNPNRGPKAVTMWWVIFNNPDQCVTNPPGAEQCGPVDIFGQAYLDSVQNGAADPSLIAPNLAAGVGVVYATGGITSRSGHIRLAASIYRSAQSGLNLGGDQVIDPLGLGTGFHNTDAEIHLVVRGHGRRVPHGRITQITNFLEPFCSDPDLGFVGGDNLCDDKQVAMYAPGETGVEAMISLANGSLLSNARAYLFRQGDVLQAVVETRVRD